MSFRDSTNSQGYKTKMFKSYSLLLRTLQQFCIHRSIFIISTNILCLALCLSPIVLYVFLVGSISVIFVKLYSGYHERSFICTVAIAYIHGRIQPSVYCRVQFVCLVLRTIYEIFPTIRTNGSHGLRKQSNMNSIIVIISIS